MTANSGPRSSHRGLAAVWALVVVVVVSALSLAAVARFASARRQTDQYHHRVQAEWLARAGYELATARLLTDPADYRGETVTPVPNGTVKITVTADPKEKGVYRVQCEARYPTLGHGATSRLERVLRRTDVKDGYRVEPVRPVAAVE